MKEPKRIKLNDTPSAKDVKKIRLTSNYDLTMKDDIYIRPDNDSIYKPINNENNKQNNSQSISELESL